MERFRGVDQALTDKPRRSRWASFRVLVVLTYGVLWLVFDRDNFGWHGLAVLATWFMTLLIQRAEYRDTQAIHAKLDELLHAQARANNGLTHIDEREPEDIERHREKARQAD